MFSLIWAWINGRVNNREAGDLRRYCAHYDVIVIRETHLIDVMIQSMQLKKENGVRRSKYNISMG